MFSNASYTSLTIQGQSRFGFQKLIVLKLGADDFARLLRRIVGCGLFGRTGSPAVETLPDFHFDGEYSRVPRPGLFDQPVFRAGKRPVACQPIQLRAEIMGRTCARKFGQRTLTRNHQTLNQPTRLRNSAIQIHGGQNGLKGIHEQPLFLPTARGILPVSEAQMLPELEPVGCVKQVRRTDEVILQCGETAF